jgi:hypothetical protein
LPGYEQRARERRQEQAAQPRVATKPLTAAELSLPAERYVAAYTSADWGTVEFQIEGGHLVARFGDLRPRLHAAGEQDAFSVTMLPGDPPEGGHFEFADGQVTAVHMPVMGQSRARFVRVPN